MPPEPSAQPTPSDAPVSASETAPAARPNRAFQLFYGVGSGVLIGLLITPLLLRAKLSPLLMWLLLVLAWYVVVVVHEAGHMIGGMRVGFRPLIYAIGPIMLRRNGERWRLERNFLTSAFGGFASATPSHDHDLPARMRVFVAGGPIASFVLFLVSVPLFLLLFETIVGAFVALVGLLSLMAGLLSLSPRSGDKLLSDGARLQMLKQGGPKVERWCALILLNPVMRPRDYPPELVERLIALADGSYDEIVGVVLAYSSAVDRGDIGRGKTLLDRMLALPIRQVSLTLHSAVMLDAASFTARFGSDPVQARAFLEAGRTKLPLLRPSVLKVEAHVLFAEGKREEAHRKALEAVAQLHRVSNPGIREMMREQLEELIADTASAATGAMG